MGNLTLLLSNKSIYFLFDVHKFSFSSLFAFSSSWTLVCFIFFTNPAAATRTQSIQKRQPITHNYYFLCAKYIEEEPNHFSQKYTKEDANQFSFFFVTLESTAHLAVTFSARIIPTTLRNSGGQVYRRCKPHLENQV